MRNRIHHPCYSVFEQLRQRRSSSGRLDATTLQRICSRSLEVNLFLQPFLVSLNAPDPLLRLGSARFGGAIWRFAINIIDFFEAPSRRVQHRNLTVRINWLSIVGMPFWWNPGQPYRSSIPLPFELSSFAATISFHFRLRSEISRGRLVESGRPFLCLSSFLAIPLCFNLVWSGTAWFEMRSGTPKVTKSHTHTTHK